MLFMTASCSCVNGTFCRSRASCCCKTACACCALAAGMAGLIPSAGRPLATTPAFI